MYKKCYSERLDKKYYEEMEGLTVWERKKQIKNPKIKYYYPTKSKFSKDKILVIDENGMNFLKDNYPIDKWGLEEIEYKKVVIEHYYMTVKNPSSYYIGKLSDGTNYGENRKKDDKKNGVIRYYVKNNWIMDNEKIRVDLDGYKLYHYDSTNRLIMEENYRSVQMGIDKWGNFTKWDNQLQRVIHTKMFLGSSGTMYFNDNRLRMTKDGVKNFFNDFYFKWVDRTFLSRK
jgi:hypothetical protein